VAKQGTARKATGVNIVIRRMRLACWITKVTYTHRIRNAYCLSIAKIVTRTRLNIALYLHCLSCHNERSWDLGL
jgi:hypothetical protein